MVAITVVLAAVLYVMVSGLVAGPGSTPTAIGVSVSQSNSGENWVLLFADVPAGKANATISLSIADSSGVTQFTATLDTLGALPRLYDPVTGGSAISAGDKILLDVLTYPAGSTYQLFDANGVLATGTLQ